MASWVYYRMMLGCLLECNDEDACDNATDVTKTLW